MSHNSHSHSGTETATMMDKINQRYLWEWMLTEAGIESGHCIGMDPEEVADRLLKGLFVGIASNGVLEVTVKPFDEELDRVGPSDFDVGEGYEVKRVLELKSSGVADALRDCREALCIAVSMAFADFDLDDLDDENECPLHASQAQLLLVRSGLPFEPWDVAHLKAAATFASHAGRELTIEDAGHLVTFAEREYLDSLDTSALVR